MIKRNIKETTTEYDSEGKVLRTTVIETMEEDDNFYQDLYRCKCPTSNLDAEGFLEENANDD